MKNRPRTKAPALFACLIGVAVLLIAGFGLIESILNKTETVVTDKGRETAAENARIYYNSAWYAPKDDLETVLVMGIDSSADGREEYYQADFLAVLLVQKDTGSFQLLHLNRDTMTEIPMLDIAGMEAGTTYGQLALAYTYGNNDHSRCRNTVKAVERLLYGVRIDHYISLTMDAVAILNDSLGGVTLRIPEDLTAVDPAFRKDAVVTLDGAQALTFVRARGGLEDSSNLSRMERQRQYMGALFECFAASDSFPENRSETLLAVSEHMVSDYTVDQLTSLSEALRGYEYGGIRSLAGDAVKGAEYMEYYVDETDMQATVIELFYEITE